MHAYDLLLDAAVDWRDRAATQTDSERAQIAKRFDDIAVKAARMAAYFETVARNGVNDRGHAAGVKAQNKAAKRVRKALGYVYPESELSF